MYKLLAFYLIPFYVYKINTFYENIKNLLNSYHHTIVKSVISLADNQLTF